MATKLFGKPKGKVGMQTAVRLIVSLRWQHKTEELCICTVVPWYLGTQVALWVKPQSLGLAYQKVGGSNPRDGVSSRCSVPAPAHLAVRKHVKVQVDK